MNSDSRAPIIITEEGEGQGHSPDMNSEGQEDFPKMNSTDFGDDMEHHPFDWNEKLDEFKSQKNIYANRFVFVSYHIIECPILKVNMRSCVLYIFALLIHICSMFCFI